MKLLRNLSIIIFVCLLSWLLSYRFGIVYEYFVPGSGGSFVDGTSFVGLLFGYVFLLPLLLIGFGRGKKNMWLVVALFPAFLTYLLDVRHLYFPIIFCLIGWSVGFGIEKLINKFKVVSKRT